jgi:lysylphosphatidylglycerol synthetase-like protein (DUF2156 family)
MKVIPSNFSRYDELELVYTSVSLSKKCKWICNTKVPYGKPVDETFLEIIKQLPDDDLIFDGCSVDNKDYLKNFGFKFLSVGKEAILNLSKDIFQKKSLRELVGRGKKHGTVIELHYSRENKELLQNFISQTSHGKKPQLKNLFETSYQAHHRLFVFISEEKWIAAIMLSLKNKKFVYTELILRRSDAPVGIMEALIYEIVISLKAEGFEHWSLGAVPFVVYDAKLFSLSWFINFIGRKIRFAYNYKGLFNFKNKFNPDWEPVFLCYKNKLHPVQILRLSQKTNLIKLILYNISLKLNLHYGR